MYIYSQSLKPDNKVRGANMGPTWILSAPDGPHEPCYQGSQVYHLHPVERVTFILSITLLFAFVDRPRDSSRRATRSLVWFMHIIARICICKNIQSLGPFCKDGSTLTPVWISNHMSSRVRDEIT